MRIDVTNYYGLRQCVLRTTSNHAVIGGLNGCGKSLFLSAIVAECSSRTMLPAGAEVCIDPEPSAFVYYPPERHCGPPHVLQTCHWDSDIQEAQVFSIHPHDAPSSSVHHTRQAVRDTRLSAIEAAANDDLRTRCGFEIASPRQLSLASIPYIGPHDLHRRVADPRTADTRWEQFRSAFKRLTTKEPQAPLALDVLSSGEKQVASLLYEVVASCTGTLLVVDEIDTHLHPSLQARALEELVQLLPEGVFLLATTHSPTIILSSGDGSAWWMEAASDEQPDRNQLECMGGYWKRTRSVFRFYSDCDLARRIPEIVKLGQQEDFATFLDECYLPAGVVAAARDSDTQVRAVHESLSTLLVGRQGVRLLDFGSGEGRCVRRLQTLPEEQKSKLEVILIDSDKDRAAKLRDEFTNMPHGFREVIVTDDLAHATGVDYAIAANVLHEIPHRHFVRLFSQLWNGLAVGGQLHVLDIAEIPRGERGYCQLSAGGYRSLSKEIGAEAIVDSFARSRHLNLIHVHAGRSGRDPLTEAQVRLAYHAALTATRDDCLAKLDGELEPLHAAFYLRNLEAVIRALLWLDSQTT